MVGTRRAGKKEGEGMKPQGRFLSVSKKVASGHFF